MNFSKSQNPSPDHYKSPLLPKPQYVQFVERGLSVSDPETIPVSDDQWLEEEEIEEEKKSSSDAQSTTLKKPKRNQIKNACVNCQKSCKKCDDGRPCQRCIKYDLTETCQSSVRKGRKKETKRRPYNYKHQREGNTNRKRRDATSSSTSTTPSSNEKMVLFKIYSPETVKEQIQQQQAAISLQKSKKRATQPPAGAVHLSHPSNIVGYNKAMDRQQNNEDTNQPILNNTQIFSVNNNNSISSSSKNISLSSVDPKIALSDNHTIPPNQSSILDHQQIPREQLLEIFSFNGGGNQIL